MITTTHNRKTMVRVIVIGATILGVMLLTFAINTIIGTYATGVSINGERVGFVENKEELDALIEEVREELSQENHNAEIQVEEEAIELEYLAEQKDEVEMIDDEQLKEELVSSDTVAVSGSAVIVDGNQILCVGSEDDANDVLEAIKNEYIVDGEDIVAEFQEEITVTQAAVDLNTLISTESAVTYLMTGNEQIEQYTVKEDDTDWDIAMEHGLTEEEIQDANPDMDTAVIKEGDVLNISKIESFVHLKVTATISEKEETEFETTEVKSDELYKGESKVQKEGEKGETLVTKRAIYVNGEEKESEVIEEQIIKEPEAKVVLVGTKEGYADNSTDSYTGGSGTLSRPMKTLQMSSPFGQRNGKLHAGIDYRNPEGTPIYAAAGGTVTYSGWMNGYGYTVMISHGNGLVTLYGHCSALYVNSGENVSRGQNIAGVGSTGRSTGNHLHFEVRLNGTPVNPLNYL